MEFSFQEILYNGIDDMVFVVKVEDQTFRYEFINKSAKQILKLNHDILGSTFKDVLPREQAEFLNKKYQEVIIKRESITYEDSYRVNAGEMHYSQVKLTPIFDENGKCIRIVSVVRDITKEKSAQSYVNEMVERIAESNERYQSLFTHNPNGILTFDKKGRITNGNVEVVKITGFDIMELVGKSFVDIIYEDIYLLQQLINEALNGRSTGGEFLLKDKSGNILTINLKVVPLILENEVIGLFGMFKDITEEKKNIEKLEENEKRFRIIAENAHDLITLVDKNGEITYVSPSYQSILGYPHKEYVGKHFIHNVHPDDLGRFMDIVRKSIQSGEPFKIEFRQKNANGEMLWCESIGKPVFNQKNKFQHLVVLTRDISLRKDYESKLKHFAYHDTLTGLPNRLLLKERFEIAKEHFLKENNGLALIILDMDNFKPINDTYGHDIGDLVIKEFGRRIKECVRDHDTVARLGGDEFVILLTGIQNEKNAIKIAERIINKMEQPWKINGEKLMVTTSIGIAMAPNSKNFTKSSLMKNADLALYQAKDSGKNAYKIYDDAEFLLQF